MPFYCPVKRCEFKSDSKNRYDMVMHVCLTHGIMKKYHDEKLATLESIRKKNSFQTCELCNVALNGSNMTWTRHLLRTHFLERYSKFYRKVMYGYLSILFENNTYILELGFLQKKKK